MSNRYYTQFFWTPHKMPVMLNCNFIVDSTNGNGLGLRSLKGSGIKAAYMNTSASFTGTLNSTVNVTGIASGTSSLAVGMPVSGTNIPASTTIASIVSSSAITISNAATGSGATTISYAGVGSPTSTGPAAGIILVEFQDCFPSYLAGFAGFVSPPTGSATQSITAGNAYSIASVGSTTAAQWQAVGLLPGVTPNASAAFVASVTGSISGSGTVFAAGVSGDYSIEVIGDGNQTINPTIRGNGSIVMQALGPTSTSNPTPVPKAPSNNSVVGLSFIFNNSTAPGGKAGGVVSF